MRDVQRRSTPVWPGPRTALAMSGMGHGAGLSAEAFSPPRPAIDTARHVNKTVRYQRTGRPPLLRGPRSLAARTAVLRRGPTPRSLGADPASPSWVPAQARSMTRARQGASSQRRRRTSQGLLRAIRALPPSRPRAGPTRSPGHAASGPPRAPRAQDIGQALPWLSAGLHERSAGRRGPAGDWLVSGMVIGHQPRRSRLALHLAWRTARRAAGQCAVSFDPLA